jgi:hypothetical protein
METFYSKTSKGALIETTVVGENPNKKGEFLYVRLKREVGGKFTAELHSYYQVNGTLTVTDPTSITNTGFIVHVIVAVQRADTGQPAHGAGASRY